MRRSMGLFLLVLVVIASLVALLGACGGSAAFSSRTGFLGASPDGVTSR